MSNNSLVLKNKTRSRDITNIEVSGENLIVGLFQMAYTLSGGKKKQI